MAARFGLAMGTRDHWVVSARPLPFRVAAYAGGTGGSHPATLSSPDEGCPAPRAAVPAPPACVLLFFSFLVSSVVPWAGGVGLLSRMPGKGFFIYYHSCRCRMFDHGQ